MTASTSANPQSKLTGQAAIVTGGGTGIGRATSIALARHGCAVVVNYSKSQTEAEDTVDAIIALGGKALAVQGDVAEDAACRLLVDAAVRTFGRLDIVVNNAATTRFVPLDDLDSVTDEDWQRILGVNLVGPFHMARAAKHAMLAAGGGHVINISSVAAYLGKGSSIPYAASKAALNNLTIALAKALAPQIRVNAVAPGFVDSRWLLEGMGERIFERSKKSFNEKLPLGRVCLPEDIAEAILGLLLGSSLMTGQTVVVDGGMLIAGFNA